MTSELQSEFLNQTDNTSTQPQQFSMQPQQFPMQQMQQFPAQSMQYPEQQPNKTKKIVIAVVIVVAILMFLYYYGSSTSNTAVQPVEGPAGGVTGSAVTTYPVDEPTPVTESPGLEPSQSETPINNQTPVATVVSGPSVLPVNIQMGNTQTFTLPGFPLSRVKQIYIERTTTENEQKPYPSDGSDWRTMQVAELLAYNSSGTKLSAADYSAVEMNAVYGTYSGDKAIDGSNSSFAHTKGTIAGTHFIRFVLKNPTDLSKLTLVNRVGFNHRMHNATINVLDSDGKLLAVYHLKQ